MFSLKVHRLKGILFNNNDDDDEDDVKDDVIILMIMGSLMMMVIITGLAFRFLQRPVCHFKRVICSPL